MNGYLLAAANGRLDFYSAEKGLIRSIPIPGVPICIGEDKQGNIWIGLNDGLAYVDVQKNTVRKYPGNFDGTDYENRSYGGTFPVSDIACASDGSIWFSCFKYGLFSCNPATGVMTPHRQKNTTPFSTYNRAASLKIVHPDSIWLGTFSGLVCYLPKKDSFINFDQEKSLKSAYIYSLALDSNKNLWGRGNTDLFAFNPSNGQVAGSIMPGETDISNFMQRITISADKLLLGHNGGFTIIDTKSFLKQPAETPQAYISQVMVNNEPVIIDRDQMENVSMRLPHYQNRLSFEVTAIEFNHPGAVEFRYRLDGLDKNWREGGTRYNFNYNYLPPGKYKFSVFVINSRNNTKSATRSFSFVISPAWWQLWWLWPLVAILFTGIVIVIARKRIANIRKKEKEKTAVNKAMAELEIKMMRSQMNPHFIFNSLNSIQKYIWENKEEDAAEYLSRFAKLMRAILENSRRESVSLKEEIVLTKLYVELEHRRSNGSFEYHILVDENLDQEMLQVPPLIMQPFIENAIWHGLNKKSGRGRLEIKISKKQDKLICSITDDGPGFAQVEARKTGSNSLGIEITRQRLEKLMQTTGRDAGIEINSTPASPGNEISGTVVIISLPLQTA